MTRQEIHSEVKALLDGYLCIVPEEGMDAGDLTCMVQKRQEIIDAIAEIDDSLAVVRQAIADSEDLTLLLNRARVLDRAFADLAQQIRDQLHQDLEKVQHGRTAARGYRMGYQRSPIMVDRSL